MKTKLKNKEITEKLFKNRKKVRKKDRKKKDGERKSNNNFISNTAKEGDSYERTKYIYTISSLKETVEHSLSNYYNLEIFV